MEAHENQHAVLVVEDEVFIRISAVAALQEAGFVVLQAGGSAEALEVLSTHGAIDILISDVQMPGDMDGLSLVTLLKRSRPAVQSIVVSANNCAEDARAAGALTFLAKPYRDDRLVQIVTDLLGRNVTPLGHAA